MRWFIDQPSRGALYRSVGLVVLCAMPLAIVWGLMRGFLALVFQNNAFACITQTPILTFYIISRLSKLGFRFVKEKRPSIW